MTLQYKLREFVGILKAAGLLAVVFIPLFFILPYASTNAASLTWDGEGATNNWSECANWSGDVCPGAGDTALFNITSSKDAVIDSGFTGTVDALQINSTYAGTVSLDRSLIVNGYQQTGGTFTAGSQPMTINTSFLLSGGDFTASSGVTTVNHTFTIAGGTFNANVGTVDFGGTANHSLNCNGAVFNAVTLSNTGGTMVISSDCTLPLGTDPVLGSTSSIALDGVLTGSGTLRKNSSTLNLRTGGQLSGFTGLIGATVQVNGNYDFSSYTAFNLSSNFTIGATGTFTAPSDTARFRGNFTINSGGTFNANGGTVDFSGSSINTLSCNNATFNLVTFTHTAGTKTVDSNCNLPLGSNPGATAGGSITLNGTLSGSGTLNTQGSGSLLTLGSGGALSGFTGLQTAQLTIAGSYDFSSYTYWNVNSTFTLSAGGTLTMPPVTAVFNGGNFTISASATFNANGGTVNFNGAGGTITCNGAIFNMVTLTYSTGTKTIANNCILPLGNDPMANNGGSIVLQGTLSGTGTLTTRGLTLGNGGALSGFNGLVTQGLNINGSYNFSGYTTFTVNGGFDINSTGVFTAPSGTANFGGNFTINPAATFDANGGTVTFIDANTITLSCGNKTFNLVVFNKSSGAVNVGSNCVLPLGNNPYVMAGGFELNGTFSGSGTLTKSSGSLTLTSGSALSGFSGLVTEGNLTVSGAYNFTGYVPFTVGGNFTASNGSVVTLSDGANFNGNFTLQSGSTVTSSPGTINLASNVNINAAATFNPNGGTVNITGSSSAPITCTGNVFNLVMLTNTGTKNVNAGCILPLGNDPTIGSGSINLFGELTGSGTLTKPDGGVFIIRSGGLTTGFDALSVMSGFAVFADATYTPPPLMYVYKALNIAGSFAATSGTVIMAGSNAANNITGGGSVTFYNLTKIAPNGDKFEIREGITVTVLGTLTLQGGPGGLLRLQPNTPPGLTWYLDVRGATNVAYVDVANSDASIGESIVACDSVDSGGNSGWDINPISCYPVQATSTAITNFALLQTSLATQANQAANQAFKINFISPNSNNSSGLLGQINELIEEFPAGKELMKAIILFLKFVGGLVLLGIILTAFIIWKRRHKKSNESNNHSEFPPIITPSGNTSSDGSGGTTMKPAGLFKHNVGFENQKQAQINLRRADR